MISNAIIMIMECIGTISFAISGSLVAIGCSLDLFGVITVGCVTAVGGGILRDLLIGELPPKIFFRPEILLLSIITSIIVFIIAYLKRKSFNKFRERLDKLNIIFDAIGLATFSVAGVEIVSTSNNALLAITLGTLTGVGGGVLRDILVNEKPYILTKHIYAVASILGSGIYYLISIHFNFRIQGTLIAAFFMIIVRLLSAKFRWKLPKIEFKE